MDRLNRSLLPALHVPGLEIGPRQEYPVRVMQFGEGNFLRAFIDWMIDKSNEAGKFNGMVQLVQPLPQGTADLINEQDGLYTLILRGMENGSPAEYKRVITCVKGCLKTATEWNKVVECACLPTLELVFSNTTEAGIEYRPELYTPGEAQSTFPAKVTSLLYERFKAGRKGLVFVPCELIDRNGQKLKECILRYAADWKLGDGFTAYVENDCAFLNTLVDRIVAGYPRAEAEAYCKKLGYEDKLLDCGEIFHLFVIEGDEKYRSAIPFAEAGRAPRRGAAGRGHGGEAVLCHHPCAGAYVRHGCEKQYAEKLILPENLGGALCQKSISTAISERASAFIRSGWTRKSFRLSPPPISPAASMRPIP